VRNRIFDNDNDNDYEHEHEHEKEGIIDRQKIGILLGFAQKKLVEAL
jgi:hypothetical protein